MKHYSVWQNAWKAGYENPIDITIPADWNVEYLDMPADHMPNLSTAQILEKIQHPINSPTIRELAAKGKNAVIVFDDITRGTQPREIVKIVLDELLCGGVLKENIRFLCATGCHGAMTREDFVRKLGEKIVREYPVFNHNAFGNCVQIGTDKEGIPIEINEEYLSCDIRIGIGAVSPHPFNGYGGGVKILFPGLASIRTAMATHARREFGGAGNRDNCGFRTDIESMAALTGPFFKIDVILNAALNTVDLFAGDVVTEYAAASLESSRLNALSKTGEKDVVIVNANAKYNESLMAVSTASQVVKEGGDIVLINHCPAGQVTHYLYSAFGLQSTAPLNGKGASPAKMRCGRLIYYTPYPDYTSITKFSQPEKIFFATKWDEVLSLLNSYGGNTEACLISDGSISYFP